MILSVNGENIADADSTHPVLSDEFLSRKGCFETMRIYSGSAFRQAEHIARFRSAADKLDIAIPLDIEPLIESQISLASASGLKDAFMRVTLTQQENASALVTLITKLPPRQSDAYERGIRVATSTIKRNEFAPTAGIKTTAWLLFLLRFRAASPGAIGDAILHDTSGHLSEATASNIFLLLDGALVTPPMSCGALPGITRATVIDIARGIGLRVEDSLPVSPEQVAGAAEMFLTSSIREIVPVVAVDARQIGSGRPGTITRKIMKAYEGMTR